MDAAPDTVPRAGALSRTRRAILAATLAGALALASRPAAAELADELWTMEGDFSVEVVAEGLDFPWSLAFLPDGDMLVSEKFEARLRRVSPDGTIGPPIAGVPEVQAEENGGLLGLALHPDFARNRLLYLAYAEPGPDGTAGLAVARARLARDRLADLAVIFRQAPKTKGPQNFGGRLLFAPDGTLFVLTGNRFADEAARRPDTTIGKIVRIREDGTIPPDNPFAGAGGAGDGPGEAEADPAVWSLGHRNLGGGAFQPGTGRLFTAEFGPFGGDELNVPRRAGNYGWPWVSWGRHYDGRDIPDPPTRPEFDREIFFWSPTIGPSGMTFYDGELIEPWRGNLLIGGLTSRSLVRLTVKGDRVLSEERMPIGARVRDVAVGPDGAVWLLTDEADGKVLRIAPAPEEEGG